MHQVRAFHVQFTVLVLWESLSYPSKIDIVTEISLTESILNRIGSSPKSVAIPSSTHDYNWREHGHLYGPIGQIIETWVPLFHYHLRNNICINVYDSVRYVIPCCLANHAKIPLMVWMSCGHTDYPLTGIHFRLPHFGGLGYCFLVYAQFLKKSQIFR